MRRSDRSRAHYLSDATAPTVEPRGSIDDCATGSNRAITVSVTSPQQAVESSQPPAPVHAPQFATGAACVAEQAHSANALPVFGVACNWKVPTDGKALKHLFAGLSVVEQSMPTVALGVCTLPAPSPSNRTMTATCCGSGTSVSDGLSEQLTIPALTITSAQADVNRRSVERCLE